jgi:hypothetical protein
MNFVKNTNNRYTVTKNGIVFDLKSNRTLTIGKKGTFSIVNELGNRQVLYLTRILWEIFNGPIPINYIIKKHNINDESHIDNLVCIPNHLMHKNPSFKLLDGFKPIINYEARYLIAEDAKIFSIISNKFFKNNIGKNNNYINVKLVDSNFKIKVYLLHRLVYCTYHNLPLDSDIIIDHIDQNKLNNNLSNLRILSASENGKNCTPKSKTIHNPIMQYDKNNKFIAEHHSLIKISKKLHCDPNTIKKVLNLNILCKNGFFWKQQLITDIDEKYVYVKVDGEYYPNYKVNKNGDIINKYNKQIMFRKINNYYKITLWKNNKNKEKLVHRIVYESFNPNINLNKETLINHLDENRQNNNIENLKVVTHKQNITYSLGKKIAQLDDDGQIIKIFDSANEAAKYLNKINGGHINQVCNGKAKTAYGYKWKYI